MTEIPRKEAWALLQAWREIYCLPHREATGKWVIHGGHGWHTFSYGYFRYLEKRHAFRDYGAESGVDLLVLPEDEHTTAIRCSSARPIDFSPLGLDLYVAPASYAWTMVFTHEQQAGYGPYFARVEWGMR